MVEFSEIQKAHNLIRDFIHRTPVLTSRYFDALLNSQLFFKCENFQKVGAFKIRGATNAVFSLDAKDLAKGVATHSSGNHGAALAQAARWKGVPATIVVPKNAPEVKKNAMVNYGAKLLFCEPTNLDRESELEKFLEKSGATFIHPFNNHNVIAGQGTAAKELCEEIEKLDTVVVPVGGGGLLSGTALAVKSMFPDTKVIAAEPEIANDAYLSLKAGEIVPIEKTTTIADGLRTSLGDLTFPIIQSHVDEIVTVSESSILSAMKSIWERMKIVVEPSSAVPLAALLSEKIDAEGKRVGIILTGGNVDLLSHKWFL